MGRVRRCVSLRDGLMKALSITHSRASRMPYQPQAATVPYHVECAVFKVCNQWQLQKWRTTQLNYVMAQRAVT